MSEVRAAPQIPAPPAFVATKDDLDQLRRHLQVMVGLDKLEPSRARAIYKEAAKKLHSTLP